MRLRIRETVSEAFGDRFFGFGTMALLPAAYIIVKGMESTVPFNIYGTIAFIYVLFWLAVIRFTLD